MGKINFIENGGLLSLARTRILTLITVCSPNAS